MEPNADMRHAIRYALTAIDEHLMGVRIDWHDVRDVLKRAIGEERANVHLTATAPRGGCGMSGRIICESCGVSDAEKDILSLPMADGIWLLCAECQEEILSQAEPVGEDAE